MESKRKRQLEECVIRILQHGDMNRMTESTVRKLAAEETGFNFTDPVNVKIVKRTIEEFFVKGRAEGGGLHNKIVPAKVVFTKPPAKVTSTKPLAKVTSTKTPAKEQPTAQPTRRRNAIVVDEDEEEEAVEARRRVSDDATSTKPHARQQPTAQPTRRRNAITVDEDEEEEKVEARRRVNDDGELVDDSEDEEDARKHSGQRPERKRVSISEISEDEKPPPKKQSTDSNNSVVCQLSKTRSISVQDFKGKILVSIREYYEKDGQKLPTQKGISLTLEQWKALKEGILDVEAAIMCLQR